MVNKSSTSINMSFEPQYRGELKFFAKFSCNQLHQLTKSLWGIEEAHAIRLKDQQMKLVPKWQQADSTSVSYNSKSLSVLPSRPIFAFPFISIQNLQ